MVCLRNMWFIVRLFRRRNNGVPKTLCGSVRWSRHRKGGVPKKLCVQ